MKMKINDAVAILKDFNVWRRYDGPIDKSPSCPDVKDIGVAIDTVVEHIENGGPVVPVIPFGFTKDDYMKLDKERLAEMLVARDKFDMERRQRSDITPPPCVPPQPIQPVIVPQYNPPCYAPDGICTNPFHDCMNCPRMFGGTGAWATKTNINTQGSVEDHGPNYHAELD